jgi:hypothetical protein
MRRLFKRSDGIGANVRGRAVSYQTFAGCASRKPRRRANSAAAATRTYARSWSHRAPEKHPTTIRHRSLSSGGTLP